MERQNNINMIKLNALTVNEVCEILEVSKQMVSKYVKDEKLDYIKKTLNGYLFYRPDVIKFKYEMNNQISSNNFNLYRNIKFSKDSMTRECLKYFNDNIHDFNAINRVNIYFNEIDPILEGYYEVEGPCTQNDHLFRISAPRMIIKDYNDNETWLSGVNTGYRGQGPSGSRSILLKLGVPDNLASEVYLNRVVKFQKEDQFWELVTSRDSVVEEKWGFNRKGDITGDLYYYKGRLILVQNKQFGWDNGNLIKLIEKYKAFIPEAIEITLYLNRGEAQSKGFYRNNLPYLNGAEIYQLIIQDKSGRELWMNLDLNEYEDLSEHEDLNSIIRACGFHYQFEKDDRSLWGVLTDWITNGGKQNKPKINIRR